jgi:P27 family predicted phage terminase small subunit
MAGNVGRPNKPTNLKLITGNPGKRPLNLTEVRPPLKEPKCPAHLNADAKKFWKVMVPELLENGLLTGLDGAALALCCQAYGRWVEAERAIRAAKAKARAEGKPEDTGLIVKTPKGYPIHSPFLAIANKAMEQVYQYLGMFGMSPASRSRVTASPQLELQFPDDKREPENKAAQYF